MATDIPANDDEVRVMLREIALQPQFVLDSIAGVVARAREALAVSAGPRVRAGFTIGCGDSYFAGLAARAYLSARTRMWFEPVEALEFSGYLGIDLPPERIVIGVSNSGTVARTVEAVRLARERGAWTLAVTVNGASPLAQAAHTLVQLDAVPNIKRRADGTSLVTPGSITYTASLVGVFAAAIALGVQLGSLTEAGARSAIEEIERVAAAMADADASVAALAPQLASTFNRERTLVIAGAGPNYATAAFGAAKWFEALQWPAHHVQTEEWAHQHYFLTGPMTDTIVLLPPGGGYERGLEQLRAAREMGSRTIAVAERGDVAAQYAADVVIGMPPGIPEPLTPLVYKLPFEYLAAQIAALHGIAFFGFGDPLRQRVNFRQIFGSAQASTQGR